LADLCQVVHDDLWTNAGPHLYRLVLLVPKVQIRRHHLGMLVVGADAGRHENLSGANVQGDPGQAVQLTCSCTPNYLRRWDHLRVDEAAVLHALQPTSSCSEQLLHGVTARMGCLLPDKHRLIADCGKLARLGEMLQDFKRQGSKCVIFTQFSKMLDVLEAFISHHRFTYVRLDGTVKVEKRQGLVDCFNADERIFLFISSTRSGGVGINLTGANIVIFYDSDWNPAMDRQAMDRAHRIGQTREVHIYRLLTAHTVEENIWKRQLQKRELDDVVVDQGRFNVDSLQGLSKKASVMTASDVHTMLTGAPLAANDAFRRDLATSLVGSAQGDFERALGAVEDAEDAQMAQSVRTELQETEQALKRDFAGQAAPAHDAPADTQAPEVEGGGAREESVEAWSEQLPPLVKWGLRQVRELRVAELQAQRKGRPKGKRPRVTNTWGV